MLEPLLNKVAYNKNCILIKRDSSTVLSCEYCETFKNSYFEEHLWTAAFLTVQGYFFLKLCFCDRYLDPFYWLFYGVPFVPLHLHMKDKLNIFGALISKWSLDFKIELRFSNGALIWKQSFDFEMELRFQNKIKLRFQNWTLISKWSFDFKIKSSYDFEMKLRFRKELWFQNQASISKWSFDFKIELRF